MTLAKCLRGLEDYVTANYHRYDGDDTGVSVSHLQMWEE